MKKKSFRDIRNAVFMLCIMLAMLSTATFAWFSMNDRVSATGMSVQAKASGSLAINKEAVVEKGTANASVDFEDESAYELIPVTYADSKWQKPKSGTKIDATTGSPNVSSNDMEDISNDLTEEVHYMDYLVYIASPGDKLEKQTLSAKVTSDNSAPTEGDAVMAAKAITVAFYVNATSADSDDVPNAHVLVDAGDTQVKTTLEIPSCAEQDAGIPIVMRVYFDGAANDGATNPTAYINSANVPTEATTVTVEFSVADDTTTTTTTS